MDLITVDVVDATGNKRQTVRVPADAPVERLLAVLIDRLNFPRHGPDGQLLSYKVQHRRVGRQLLDRQTLADADVREGDVLRLVPEITAGTEALTLDLDTTHPFPGSPDDRFERFGRIAWWDQSRLRDALAVIVGAGALGNEIVKNLALLGVGRVVIIDLDRVEHANLARSVLFRAADAGRPKAVVAADAARDIYPDLLARPIVADVTREIGLGLFRRADVILGGLDNREARLFVSRACLKLRKPWVDAGIDTVDGYARVFRPGVDAPCYECTLGEADWRLLRQRRACNGLTRQQMQTGHTPTTPTIASIVAGVACQEAVKLLHGLPTLDGRAFTFSGLAAEAYNVDYPRDPHCPSHEPLPMIVELDSAAADTTVADLFAAARRHLQSDAVRVELTREIVTRLDCPACGAVESTVRSLSSVTPEDARCPGCRSTRVPATTNVIHDQDVPPDTTLPRLGVPPFDILTVRGFDGRAIGLELTADAPTALGDLFPHLSTPGEPQWT